MSASGSRTVHVWRMRAPETDQFAASDEIIACEGASEDEAHIRAGWGATSLHGRAAEYLGPMTFEQYEKTRADHLGRTR